MAETHQTTVATPPPTADPAIILPRSQDTPAPETGDPSEKAAREAKERMTKTSGFWNRLSPDKEGAKPDKSAEAQSEKPPKKDEKPIPATAATTKAPADAPADEDDPKAEKKPSRRKKEPEIDPIELARATGQEIGREMAKASKTAAPQPAAPEVEPELPEEFRADVAVFDEMSRLDPKRYGNIKKELAQYAAKESEYIAKWEKEHDGETYNGDDPEHNAFYEKIQPKYEQKDFKQAQESLIEQKVERRILDKIQTREAETERRRERATQIQPEVERDMFSTMGDMIKEVDPENAALAKDWASMQTLDEKNPLLADVMVAVHNETKPVVMATMRLFRSVEAPDPNNPAHQRVFAAISEGEQRVSRLPIKERYDDEGRLFATQDEYAKMTPADKARHWYIGEREALALIRGQAISRAKSIYDQENQKIARYSKRPNATQPAQQQTTPKPEEPAQPRPDNGSPSVSGRGTLPGDGQPAGGKPATGRDLFFSRMFGA